MSINIENIEKAKIFAQQTNLQIKRKRLPRGGIDYWDKYFAFLKENDVNNYGDDLPDTWENEICKLFLSRWYLIKEDDLILKDSMRHEDIIITYKPKKPANNNETN